MMQCCEYGPLEAFFIFLIKQVDDGLLAQNPVWERKVGTASSEVQLMEANIQEQNLIEHKPTIYQCRIFDLHPHVSEHLFDDFVQVASLERFRHLTIECLINRIDSNNIPILYLDLESNPSGRLNLHSIHILDFFGHEISNTPYDFFKGGFHIHTTSSID